MKLTIELFVTFFEKFIKIGDNFKFKIFQSFPLLKNFSIIFFSAINLFLTTF